MRKVWGTITVVAALAIAGLGAPASAKTPASDDRTLVVVFKDGRQQSFPMSDVARIEFTTPLVGAATTGQSTGHFVGKWKVGDGAGSTFLITLLRNGDAEKTIGGAHGTWTVVDGEARITWEDGWHDAIRKAGSGYEKAAFEPGRSFSDTPSNIARAKKNTEPI